MPLISRRDSLVADWRCCWLLDPAVIPLLRMGPALRFPNVTLGNRLMLLAVLV